MDELARVAQRSRIEQSPQSRGLGILQTATRKELDQDIERPGKRQRLEHPMAMTAAAAMAEARHPSKSPGNGPSSTKTSPNPGAQVINALLGASQTAVSTASPPNRTASASQANNVGAGLSLAVDQLQPQSNGSTSIMIDNRNQTSPTSTTSFDAQDSITATSGIGTTVASPQPLETSPQPMSKSNAPDLMSVNDASKAMSYPTPFLQPQTNDARRGMSLPHSGLRQNTRSPSSRRHPCPYCNTEFTRHHNLKSHLLTHSQEKPFHCPTCQSRFRRLHDLKRHSKLHTGERPHVCPKCNRKFARGDALARHNKGPGGCAGRRASMGSFAEDDDMEGEEPMEGVMYNEPETMDDMGDGALKGTPSIRRQAPSGDDTMDDAEQYSRISSTYPPIQGRLQGGIASGVFPPRSSYVPVTPGVSTSHSNMANHGPTLHPTHQSQGLRPSDAGSVFAPTPLTDSPKAISPRQSQPGGLPATRSPSIPQFPTPSSFSRSHSGSGPGPRSQGSGPQLPPPHALASADPRLTLPSQGAPTHPPTQPSGPPTHMSGSGPLSSHSNSLSSHGQSGTGSGDHVNSMFNKEDRIWAYVKDLENRMNSMQDEINNLKTQLAAAASQQIRA